MRFYILAASAVLLLSAGCAPALSSFTPAHVPARHHLQAEAGLDVSIPTQIADIVDEGVSLAARARNRELTDEEQRRLFRAGMALALDPPSVVTHLGVGYTLLDRFEINGRLSSGAWHLGGRYQFLDQLLHGVDGTLAIGGGHYSYEFPISDQIPLIELEDFSRWQVDASFLVGRRGDWYRYWAGPRALFSTYGTELTFDQPAVGLGEDKRVLASIDGTSAYVGGQLGGALGYKKVFLGLELTCVKFWSTADIKILDRSTQVKVPSFIVYPGLALMFEL